MLKDLYLEKNISQTPAIELLKSMGYIYIPPEEALRKRGSKYDVILKDILRSQLKKLNTYTFGGEKKEFSPGNIERAIEDINLPLNDGLIKCSEKIFNMLLLGNSYLELLGDGKSLSFNLKYIDWDNFDNNVFHVTEEFSVESLDKEHNARPDIVLFINGIPFGVIECKTPQISVEQGIEQMVRNQKTEWIPQLFKFTQILVSTNKNTVKYATTGTPKKFWSIWREEDKSFLENQLNIHIKNRQKTIQDENIISLFSKDRVKDLIKYFVLYDANIKKICRYQQYFAIKEAMKTITTFDKKGNRKSGVVWHTQGSGKSLTMVMLAKLLLQELSKQNPKVIIITDRKELDNQIAKTFSHTRLNPAKAASGKHLVELIDSHKADVITTIINKFNTAEKMDSKNLSKDIFVLVDESHRSNYGGLATKMRTVFPNACYIGFTGTPLMKKEKNTMAKFGDLIHKYTIKDGVEDGAIVPLIYEGKFVDQNVDEENIDLWFKQVTKRLNEKERKDLKDKWSSIRRLTSTDSRIKRIALDIDEHFTGGYKNTGFKAMLATNFKKDAVRYLECFETFSDLTCAVIISPPDIREGAENIDDEIDDKVRKYWDKMIKAYGDGDKYEEAIKNKFLDGEIDILIVCSKLLTGFDAPRCQVLYIDKELKEHGLLQAIARTNRLYEGKDYGLIVDYRGLITRLNDAMDTYTGAGLENFEGGDLKGTIVDIISVIASLREANSNLCQLFITLKNSQDTEEVESYLADEKIRESFYDFVCALGKHLSMTMNSEVVYETIDRKELKTYQDNFIFYSKVRRSVKVRYHDAIDNNEYEPLMQNLLDTHLSVAGLNQITKPVDILNKDEFEKEIEELTSLKGKADAITSSMTKAISERRDENPAYYDSFSEKIKSALEEYKDKVISESEYLAKMKSILADFRENKTDITYPSEIKKNLHAQAFYGVICAILDNEININDYSEIITYATIEITKIIEKYNQVDWSTNTTIHKKIAQEIDDLFYEIEKEKALKLTFDAIDMIIENVKTVALRRFK